MTTQFEPKSKTYAIILTPTTQLGKLKTMADALGRMDADTVALWSIAPFDVQNSPDWPMIEALFSGIGRKPPVVEVVTQAEVDAATGSVSVMR